jgi:hypothetical protein
VVSGRRQFAAASVDQLVEGGVRLEQLVGVGRHDNGVRRDAGVVHDFLAPILDVLDRGNASLAPARSAGQRLAVARAAAEVHDLGRVAFAGDGSRAVDQHVAGHDFEAPVEHLDLLVQREGDARLQALGRRKRAADLFTGAAPERLVRVENPLVFGVGRAERVRLVALLGNDAALDQGRHKRRDKLPLGRLVEHDRLFLGSGDLGEKGFHEPIRVVDPLVDNAVENVGIEKVGHFTLLPIAPG